MSGYEERFVWADANLTIQEKTALAHVAQQLARGLVCAEIDYLAALLCRIATRQRSALRERDIPGEQKENEGV